ncbi:MAG: GAF domain-containing protein [Chloroflexi bacterium]|nr:GAF domain-containing protein [Chloroflexota bacterium]MBP7042963.1 GAF domain-containing protein [Chloroflexota bacterium]
MTAHPEQPIDSFLRQWHIHHQEIIQALTGAFIENVADNREEMKSVQRGAYVAAEITDLARRYLTQAASAFDVGATANQMGKQGLAIITGSFMLQAMNRIVYEALLPGLDNVASSTGFMRKLHDFQMIFMEKLAETREVVQLRAQEESQIALQQALYTQLEQQRLLRRNVEERSKSLNQILQLNARLARAANEADLLDEAVSGICQALLLEHVTIYEKTQPANVWQIRTTTADNPYMVQASVPEVANSLAQAAANKDGEFIHQHHKTRHATNLSVALILPLNAERQGALIAHGSQIASDDKDEMPILLRTFGQGLATLWRNLFLLLETRQHARELEILYGRYVDTIWRTDQAALTAQITPGGLEITRRQTQPMPNQDTGLALRIGDQTFGQIALPANLDLSSDDQEYIQTLVREMSVAINNAHLLQTTRAYSNQLQLAAEVSSVATTMLERRSLINEAVELIRARFDYYYVGLFLADELQQTAVLQAGTGEAGRIQLARNHKLTIGGGSMIGSAIANNEARVAQNVTQAVDFAPNPVLPDTRAELALPLRSRGKVIGALSVQSVEEAAFTPEAITVLQNLADQLAAAIANADLFSQIQANLTETSLLYEIGRQISEARNQGDIYNALIDFARQSGIVDLAQIIVEDNPDYLTCPAIWSRFDWSADDPFGRYPRSQFNYEDQLTRNELVIVQNPSPEIAVDDFSRRLLTAGQVKSMAMIPIIMESRWLGTLVLHTDNDMAFNVRSLQPFRTLADQAAITLANQQLLRQTELLYQIGRSLSQSLTRDDALMIAVQEIAQYTSASQCRMVLYNFQQGVGHIAAEALATDQSGEITFAMQGDFVYEHLNMQRQPLLLSKTAVDLPTAVIDHYLTQFDAEVSLLVPAASQQDLIGFLALDSTSARPFPTNHIIFAQTLVDHLTTQIENLKLLDEALTSAQELIFLNQIQSNISSILNIDHLVQTIYREVGGLIDNTIFMLAEYSEATREYKPTLTIKEGQGVPTPTRILERDEPLYAFLHSKHHLLTHANTHIALPGALPSEIAGDPAIQSGLWIPLVREGAPAGLICVQSYEPYAYRENDVQLLRSIATQSSLAMENARLFEQIQASVEQLRQIDHMKNQFLANMSHELRTPLNSIIGFSRVILKGIDGPLTTEQEEDLSSIYNNGHHLLMLINEILDMAKIGAGKMTLTFEPVIVEDAITASLTTIRSLVHEGVELISEVAPNLPLIEADPIRLRQILINLLSNATKFTRKGMIRLTAVPENSDHILLSISDTGTGIAQEDFDKLFVAFEQVDNSTTRTAGGTGLGLPITQWLVNMHHGQLWLDSELGVGTTFFIRLPIRQPDGQVTEGKPLETAVPA